MLAAKVRAADLAVSQQMPQPSFNVGSVSPEFSSELCFPGVRLKRDIR